MIHYFKGTYLTPLDVAKLRHSKDCKQIIIQYGGTTGIKVANKAALKIQRNLKRFIHHHRQKPKYSKQLSESKNSDKHAKQKSEANVSTSKTNGKEKPKLKKLDTSIGPMVTKKSLRDKNEQIVLLNPEQKQQLIIVSTTSSTNNSTAGEAAQEEDDMVKVLSQSLSTESEASQKSTTNGGVFVQTRQSIKNRHRKRDIDALKNQIKLKPIKNIPPPPPPTRTKKSHTEKLIIDQNHNAKLKRYAKSEKRATENKDSQARFVSQPRARFDYYSSSNTLSLESYTSSSESPSLECTTTNNNKNETADNHQHHHFHCHHYCYHSNKKYRIADSDNEESYYTKNIKIKEPQKVKQNVSLLPSIANVNKADFKSSNKKLAEDEENEDENSHMVKLIIKTEPMDGNTNNYQSLFERQRLLLKSLYEIRRSRLNNRSVSSN